MIPFPWTCAGIDSVIQVISYLTARGTVQLGSIPVCRSLIDIPRSEMRYMIRGSSHSHDKKMRGVAIKHHLQRESATPVGYDLTLI